AGLIRMPTSAAAGLTCGGDPGARAVRAKGGAHPVLTLLGHRGSFRPVHADLRCVSGGAVMKFPLGHVPANPSLEQLRKKAKEFRDGVRAGHAKFVDLARALHPRSADAA